MTNRREFLQHTISFGALTTAIGPAAFAANVQKSKEPLTYKIARHVPTKMYDGKRCWCHPRAGIVPGAGTDGKPRVVMTMNTLDVSGSDVFKAMHTLHTDDLGKTWTTPRESQTLAIRHEVIAGTKRPVAVSDFWPTWHAKTKTLLGTGHTVAYTPDWKVRNPRPRHTSYAAYDPKSDRWSTWKKLAMPAEPKFENAGAGCVQRYDLEDGTILLPFYFRPKTGNDGVAVMQCRFNGTDLEYVKHGTELKIDDKTRGLGEPSLTRFGGEFFLTMRNDKRAFIARSKDGLQFGRIQEWKFDDGKVLGSYNTQAHWVTHSDALFLVYTRRGANNDHVFRHRAPLFMAQVDPKKLRVIRKTERILVPERGARLGNFGVTQISEHETWVTVAEWMQTWGPKHAMPVKNKFGSDGSVFVARIEWSRPNRAFR